MSRTIRFTVTDDEYKIIEHGAESRGMKPAGLAKLSLFAYINKYPSKGVFSLLMQSRVENCQESF